MITILTAFKPFVGEALVHQTNALASWRALADDVQILVFGAPDHLARFVEPFGAEVIANIPVSQDGRARVDKIFEYGRLNGKYDRQVYVNGDIILMKDFVRAFCAIKFSKFLMIGQRMDVDVHKLLSFKTDNDCKSSRDELRRYGQPGEHGGLDYFAYRRGSIPKLPPLYLGAACWDNLMVYSCRVAGISVVDATIDVQAFHQNHQYYLMKDCSAARLNLAQAPDPGCFFNALDATHWLRNGRVKSALTSRRYLLRMISTYPIVRRWPKASRRAFRIPARIARELGYC